MTIEEAYKAMAEVLPIDSSITIQLDCWWHTWEGKRGEMDPEFMVSYHPNGPIYRGATLEAAVQSFLSAEATPPACAADVDALVKEVEATEQVTA